MLPPLPEHPEMSLLTRTLAQQLAVEAVSLVLPPFQSVDPDAIAAFRESLGDLARPFRVTMIEMTAELNAAIAAGATDAELQAQCRHIAVSKVLPELDRLSKELREPLRPWHRTVLDVTEAALYAVAAPTAAAAAIPITIVAAWALYRGARIASEYAQLYTDREGKKKSGLGYLLKVAEPQRDQRTSAWDQRDWRCSGNFDLLEPGWPLTPNNQTLLEYMRRDNPSIHFETVRRVYQDRTHSWVRMKSL
jgi:hypothetical protein